MFVLCLHLDNYTSSKMWVNMSSNNTPFRRSQKRVKARKNEVSLMYMSKAYIFTLSVRTTGGAESPMGGLWGKLLNTAYTAKPNLAFQQQQKENIVEKTCKQITSVRFAVNINNAWSGRGSAISQENMFKAVIQAYPPVSQTTRHLVSYQHQLAHREMWEMSHGSSRQCD